MSDQKTDLLVDVEIEPSLLDLNKDAKNKRTSHNQTNETHIEGKPINHFNTLLQTLNQVFFKFTRFKFAFQRSYDVSDFHELVT